MASIDRLRDVSPERVAALLADSEREGSRIVRRLVDEWMSGANRFDRPGEVLFAARLGERLVGVGGLNVDPFAGEPRLGRVRHVYVHSECRRQGIGEQLMAEILTAARGRFDRLGLHTGNPAAARLYERLGFHASAERARTTHVMTVPPPS
jgi:ribosomal protein S18 acetylase RimI-like enzyme